MAGRYSKNHSNYVLRKFHQRTRRGDIYEGDFFTIGERHQLEKGKYPFYSDSNFLFTGYNYPSGKKRHVFGKLVASWNYDDVKDSTDKINTVRVNDSSDDMRDFAYYGSAVELVRSSVLNIIKYFPARITAESQKVQLPDGIGGYEEADYYRVVNPFEVDFVHTITADEAKTANIARFMAQSYKDYLLNGKEIVSYEVVNTKMDCIPPNYTPKDGAPIYTVKLNGVEVMMAYSIYGAIVLLTTDQQLEIKMKKEKFEEYFKSLDRFERQLLNLDTMPLYSNSFITPIEGELAYRYMYRTYTWPSTFDDSIGYAHIDIVSGSFQNYVMKLTELAEAFDELWCDNLYKNMTHESIKNFDWTYTREYSDDEEQDNIDGGDRMMKLLRVYGRLFDDIKHLADGIGYVNKVSYNGLCNVPDAELSDKLEALGWDIVSTIPDFGGEDEDEVKIDKSFLEDNHFGWFPTVRPDSVTATEFDLEFMRRLFISTPRIMKSKGTRHAIEMVMGLFGLGNGMDYTLTEEYRTVSRNSFLDYDENIDKIESINSYKNIPHGDVNEDPFTGVTLGEMYYGGYKNRRHVILPYYDMNKRYDGGVIFQSNGAWGQQGEGDNATYLETVSYLTVVSNISELLNVNPHSIKEGDLYYVSSLLDIVEYPGIDVDNLTHYFRIDDIYNPQEFGSWVNVSEDDKQVKYFESIIPTNVGNNPHVGYGNYDKGETFFDYMKQPFKYSVDNGYLPDDVLKEASEVKFNISGKIEESDGPVKTRVVKNEEDTYNLNSKVFTLKNKIDNDMYRKYFKDVIFNYVSQVIPSTAILVLEEF